MGEISVYGYMQAGPQDCYGPFYKKRAFAREDTISTTARPAAVGRHVRLPSRPARLPGCAQLALASTAHFLSFPFMYLFSFFCFSSACLRGGTLFTRFTVGLERFALAGLVGRRGIQQA